MAKHLREILPLNEDPFTAAAGGLIGGALIGKALGKAVLNRWPEKGDFGKSLKKTFGTKHTTQERKKSGDWGKPKTRYEETELDEAKRTPYKRKGSLRAQVKSQADIAKEKSGRRKLAKAAIKDTKETGEKVKFRPFGRWSTKRKLKEDLQELSLQRLGAFVDKAEAEDYKKDSTKHRMGINLALRKRGEHRHTAEVPPKVRASIDGKKK